MEDANSSLHDCVCDEAINQDRKYRREHKSEEKEKDYILTFF